MEGHYYLLTKAKHICVPQASRSQLRQAELTVLIFEQQREDLRLERENADRLLAEIERMSSLQQLNARQAMAQLKSSSV